METTELTNPVKLKLPFRYESEIVKKVQESKNVTIKIATVKTVVNLLKEKNELSNLPEAPMILEAFMQYYQELEVLALNSKRMLNNVA